MLDKFRAAVESLDARFARQKEALEDGSVEAELHAWLDEGGCLPWASPCGVTADEWFFVTTLYGQMTLDGQRTHIKRFFGPLFVDAANRDIRNFRHDMPEFAGLRAPWMRQRLCKMADVLNDKNMSMSDYVVHLRDLEAKASQWDPQPALDCVKRDLQAGEAKTVSVFIRDCVKGNCFPIDSRVRTELTRWGLPDDERQLVMLSLAINRNPRVVARMFYNAGGE